MSESSFKIRILGEDSLVRIKRHESRVLRRGRGEGEGEVWTTWTLKAKERGGRSEGAMTRQRKSWHELASSPLPSLPMVS